MNSLNKRYCASSFFVVLLMVFVMGLSLSKSHHTNSFATENSALLNKDICVVRMTKKQKIQKVVNNNIKKQIVEPQKNEKMPESDVSETEVSKSPVPDENFENSVNSSEFSENEGKNEGADSAEVNETVKSYKSYVLKRIAEKKIYPLSARKKGYEGKVKIHLEIDRDGKILALEVCEPCEYEVLNNAALKAVEKAAPFKKMREVMTTLDFVFVLDFKLSAIAKSTVQV